MILEPAGFVGTDHIGFTVPDLDQAITFFQEVFGAQVIVRHEGYAPRAEVNIENFGRKPEVKVAGIVLIRIAGMNYELLQYESDDEAGPWPSTSGTGGHHVAFYVADLDAAVDSLRANGIEVLGNPLNLGGGEAGPGARFVYFRAPWGLFLELVTYPAGKAYEQTSSLRLAQPR